MCQPSTVDLHSWIPKPIYSPNSIGIRITLRSMKL